MKIVKTMTNDIPINIFKVQIDVDIKLLHEAILNFKHENDELTPYLIMNEKTLNKLKVELYDADSYLDRIEGNYIYKFEGCKIVIDCTLENGQVLLR